MPYPTTARGLIFEFNMGEARLESSSGLVECSFSNRKCGRHGIICWVLVLEMLQGVWKQHLRPRAVVGYGVKIFLPSPPNYVTRSPGRKTHFKFTAADCKICSLQPAQNVYLEFQFSQFLPKFFVGLWISTQLHVPSSVVSCSERQSRTSRGKKWM